MVNSICQTHCILQENTAKAINYNLTVRNWLIGCYIIEFEQNGQDRAKYGENLIGELAVILKTKGLKGFSSTALKNHRTFYLYYPQISQTVSGELQNIYFQLNEYDYSDAGQMNLYLNYYKDNEMSEGDNPPIGIILCSDKDDTLVKYSTVGMDNHLFVSKYLVKLPEKKVLENFMKRELNQ